MFFPKQQKTSTLYWETKFFRQVREAHGGVDRLLEMAGKVGKIPRVGNKQKHGKMEGTYLSTFHLRLAINPPLCSKKGGGHKNVRVSKTLRCVSQRKLARKQNTGISTRKLALWPRK